MKQITKAYPPAWQVHWLAHLQMGSVSGRLILWKKKLWKARHFRIRLKQENPGVPSNHFKSEIP
jgi:hypothetical protein